MARIRSIKPEFWDDYRLAMDLTRDQRLFYIGLWNQADDEGRFKAHPGRLLRAIFPYDDDLQVPFSEHALNRLIETDRLVLYVVDSEPYGQLTKFGDHQKPNRPQPSKIPSPTSDVAVRTAGSLNTQCARTAVVVGGQVGEQVVDSTAGAAAPAEFESFWSQYPKRAGSNPKRNAIRAWNARIAEGFSPADLVNGLRRYVQYCETSELIGSQYVLQAATFLGPSRRWEEPWDPPKQNTNGKRRPIDNYDYTPTEEVPEWPK